MNRRKVLGVLGGGTILAAGGAAAFLGTRTPERALRPWELAGGYEDVRKRALSFAVLAPNPHNRQPWLVDLGTADEATLHVDTTRMLPQTDPLNRQITVGLGCFLELCVQAAAQDGVRVDVALFPEGEPGPTLTDAPVARLRFVPDASVRPDPLFAHVLDRRSNKEAFDTARPVSAEVAARIASAATHGPRVETVTDEAGVQFLRRVSADAIEREFMTPRTLKESVDLLRIGKAEIEASPDGIDLGGPLFDSLNVLGMMSREAALDPADPNFQQALEGSLDNARSGMAHLVMVTDGNTRADQIRAGRDWVRLNLAATRDGVAFHPLSQALQEFDEVEEFHDAVHKRFAPRGGTVQMLSRLGYGVDVPRSPRWPLEAKLIA